MIYVFYETLTAIKHLLLPFIVILFVLIYLLCSKINGSLLGIFCYLSSFIWIFSFFSYFQISYNFVHLLSFVLFPIFSIQIILSMIYSYMQSKSNDDFYYSIHSELMITIISLIFIIFSYFLLYNNISDLMLFIIGIISILLNFIIIIINVNKYKKIKLV